MVLQNEKIPNDQQISTLNKLIQQYPNLDKFRKNVIYTNREDQSEGLLLSYSVLKIENKYFILTKQVIGKGAFGKIIKTFPLILDNDNLILDLTPRALKIILIDKNDYTQLYIKSISCEQRLINEMYGSAGTAFRLTKNGDMKAYIDMPYFADAINLPRLSSINFSFAEMLFLCLDIAKAVKKVHDLGFIHGDLKPQHVLYDNQDKSIKIIDFGLSRFGTIVSISSAVGTKAFMAPEISKGKLSKLSDIYSLGLVFLGFLSPKMFNLKPKSVLPVRLKVAHFLELMSAEDDVDRPLDIVEVIESLQQLLLEEIKIQNIYQVTIKQYLTTLGIGISSAIKLIQDYIDSHTDIECQSQTDMLKQLETDYRLQKKKITDKINGDEKLTKSHYKEIKKETENILSEKKYTDAFGSHRDFVKQVVNNSLIPIRHITRDYKTTKNFSRFGFFQSEIAQFVQTVEQEIIKSGEFIALM